MSDQELVKVDQNTALMTMDFESQAGAGNEQVRQGDLATPFLKILQALSPECEEGNPKQIPGARPGMVINTATGKLIECRVQVEGKPAPNSGLLVINTYFVPKTVIWKANRGGWAGQHDPGSPEANAVKGTNLRNEKNKLIDPDGRVWTDTHYHFLSTVEHGGVIVGMADSNMGPSRAWNSQIGLVQLPSKKTPGKSFNPPRFAIVWRLQTILKKFSEGSCYVWNPTLVGEVQDAAWYQAAQNFYLVASKGMIDFVRPPQEDGAGAGSGKPDDLPF